MRPRNPTSRGLRRSLLFGAGLCFAIAAPPGAARQPAHPRPAELVGGGLLPGPVPVAYHARLSCDADDGSARLRLQWERESFELTDPQFFECRNEAAAEPGSPGTNFDTHMGAGFGRYRGRPGAYASWILSDVGEGDGLDYAQFTVVDPDGDVVLDVVGHIRGNHHARGVASVREGGRDPVNLVGSVYVDELGRSFGLRWGVLDEGSFGLEPPDPEPKIVRVPRTPLKLHPRLEARFETGDPEERLSVVVNLEDPVAAPVPEFPYLFFSLRCDSPLGQKLELEVARRVGLRAAETGRSTSEFLAAFRGGDHTIRVEEQLWLANAFQAEVRVGDLRDLAAQRNVLFVEPAFVEIPPPHHDGDLFNDMVIARNLIGTDAWQVQAGLNGGCFGLIDSGVDATHTLFSQPEPRIAIQADCNYGGPTCDDPSDMFFSLLDSENHGTGTAGILSGNSNLGFRHRGVTDLTIDSWKVYTSEGGSVVVSPMGVATAMQRALVAGDRVLVAELQLDAPETGLVATAADNAFDAGAVVVAAAGNCAVNDSCTTPVGTPRPETIRSPGNAHKVLAVGAYNVKSLETGDYQSFGPTEDFRVKPDLQAPTDVEVASQCLVPFIGPRRCGGEFSDMALLRLGGTSGSTPFAAGAAALVRSWLRKSGFAEPGHTYARMILSGENVHPYPEREGVGPFKLPICTLPRWGKAELQPTSPGPIVLIPTVQVPLPVGPDWDHLRAAIWWPESVMKLHSDLDLYLVDPDGAEVAKGYHDGSVFERVEVDDPEPGMWTLKVKGSAAGGPQPFYWAADLQGCTVIIDPGNLPLPF